MIIIETTTQRALGLAPTPILKCSWCHRTIEQADQGWTVWQLGFKSVVDVRLLHRDACYQYWRRDNEVVVDEHAPLDVFVYTLLRTLAGNVDTAALEQQAPAARRRRAPG